MTTNEIARSQGISPVRSAVHRGVRLLIFGLIGWLGFVSAADFVWRAVSLAAILALAAIAGITWYLSNARGARQFNAALDAYAARETARARRLKEIVSAQGSKVGRAAQGLTVASADELHHGGAHARAHTKG
jgi:hypothetical protein